MFYRFLFVFYRTLILYFVFDRVFYRFSLSSIKHIYVYTSVDLCIDMHRASATCSEESREQESQVTTSRHHFVRIPVTILSKIAVGPGMSSGRARLQPSGPAWEGCLGGLVRLWAAWEAYLSGLKTCLGGLGTCLGGLACLACLAWAVWPAWKPWRGRICVRGRSK